MLANYDSEIALAANDQEFLNTSLMSGHSRHNFYGSQKKQSKSQAKVNRLNFGRIQQGNMMEVHNYIADGVSIQENSRVSGYSRHRYGSQVGGDEIESQPSLEDIDISY